MRVRPAARTMVALPGYMTILRLSVQKASERKSKDLSRSRACHFVLASPFQTYHQKRRICHAQFTAVVSVGRFGFGWLRFGNSRPSSDNHHGCDATHNNLRRANGYHHDDDDKTVV